MSGGRVWLDDGHWRVEAPPHVLVRLRRVFGQADKREMGSVTLKNTPEVCRDLEWFLERYPLPVEHPDALTGGSTAHRRRLERVEEILAPGYRPAHAVTLRLPLRSYQAVVPEIVAAQGYLLLADELGLGKTACAVGLFARADARPAVYVTPATLVSQVADEVAKFAPGLRVHAVTRSTPYPLPTFLGHPPDVLVMSWHKLHGWAEELAGKVATVVFDEAHELRLQGSLKYAAAHHLARSTRYVLGMTATPVWNYGIEIWSVLHALSEDALGSREEFIREWCSGEERVSDPAALGTYLRSSGMMLRRTRRDVARELPEVVKIPHRIRADTGALDAISSTADELARIILTQQPVGKGDKFRAAEELSNLLRQSTGVAKAPYVAEFVKMLLDTGETVCLGGWHHAVYDIWEDRLKSYRPVWFTGRETVRQKEEAVRQFRNGDTRLLIMSNRSGAGLNGLQEVCSCCVFGELDWSYGVHEQFIGRFHRDGQDAPVRAFFLVADIGADPVMAETLGLKREQGERIRDPERTLVETLGSDGGHVNRLAEHYLRSRGQSWEVSP